MVATATTTSSSGTGKGKLMPPKNDSASTTKTIVGEDLQGHLVPPHNGGEYDGDAEHEFPGLLVKVIERIIFHFEEVRPTSRLLVISEYIMPAIIITTSHFIMVRTIKVISSLLVVLLLLQLNVVTILCWSSSNYRILASYRNKERTMLEIICYCDERTKDSTSVVLCRW
jgi:hypothetical protein